MLENFRANVLKAQSWFLSDVFVICNNLKCLRCTNKLFVPRNKTTDFGLKSTTFIGAKVWNSLPDELCSTTILKEFKNAVQKESYFCNVYTVIILGIRLFTC